MSLYAERPNSIHWPPILYAAALLLPWALQHLLPMPVLALGQIADDAMVGIGWAFIGTGVTVGYLALRSFSGAGTPFDPTARAERLVTFGLYNRTRNPMYLAALVAFFGMALATGNVWRFAILLPLFLGLRELAVLREEQHLEARFGEGWRSYAASVPRWW
jgi:protein-S-isoprenylcysteine O-methyltransferase Ste14